MIKLLLKKDKLEEFKELMTASDNAVLVGKMLLVYPKEIASHKKIDVKDVKEKLNTDALIFVLEKLQEKKILENQIKEVLERIVETSNVQKAVKIKKVDRRVVEEKIFNLIREKPGLSAKAYMGLVMKEFKGKIDGKTAMEIIEKLLKQ